MESNTVGRPRKEDVNIKTLYMREWRERNKDKINNREKEIKKLLKERRKIVLQILMRDYNELCKRYLLI